MLENRGPDDENIYQDSSLSFVFRRLSIVDLSGGAQPIWDSEGRYWVAVNGEIYNHKELKEQYFPTINFATQSDSEIVLHLYKKLGPEAFSKLNGMFAVCIYDSHSQTLTLARDRLGIKPLYYSSHDKGFHFSSELKALLIHPDVSKTINWQDSQVIGLQDNEIIPTYVEGVRHFPAGHYVEIAQDMKIEITPFWNIKAYLAEDKEQQLNENEIEQQYLALLRQSVNYRLMSDVPVGIFLSGGLDSSILAALAVEQNPDIHCFTVVESNTCRSGDVDNAKLVCEKLNINFHPILFDRTEMIERFNLYELERMIHVMESPRFDLEWYYKSELHRAAKNIVPELKVILLGQGADEFAGGYSRTLTSPWQNWEEYISGEVAPSLKERQIHQHHVPERFQDLIDAIPDDLSITNAYKKKMHALCYQLQHFNLWHEDRTSSFHGVESRVPYLDHRLVEFLSTVPSEFHESLFWNKTLIRKTVKELMNFYPDDHAKVPFFLSDDNTSIDQVAKLICKNVYDEFEEKYLVSNKSYFSQSSLRNLFEQSQQNNPESSDCAWQLIEIMSLVIFEDFIKRTESFVKTTRSAQQPIYPEISVDQWSSTIDQLKKGNETDLQNQWSMDSIVAIPEHCEIVNPLSEEDGNTVLILLLRKKELSRIVIPEQYDWITMLLDALGFNRSNPKPLSHWVSKLNVDPQTLVNILANLVNGGFLVKLN